MSRTIDERVVSMQFDNRNFESNVKTSMNTLERLKQSLNLKGASKNLNELSTAAKKVDMSPLANGVENVRVKFSALQVMGVTALQNITNQAVNAGKRIASALTIDPVKSGFQEYETQINAVQTILSNTQSKGSTLEDVTKILDELNTYADQTIYNFPEMTRNIGTFTAAGVGLETSAQAIKGIANLAAMSGSTSQQASTAMYQLSQALASGTVKLMDWNSVVNAGMGGQVFQDALKQTARVHGIAIDSIIEKNGSFRDSLHEEWLTAEILTETLSHFTMAAEEGSEEWNELKQSLTDKGYTEAQAEEILKLGNNATDAATKVKTFTQMWEVLKESAQSGWAQTWKIIFGDFEDARALFTPLTNFFTNIIQGMSDARNAFLNMVFGSPIGSLIDTLKGITATAQGAVDTIKDLGDVVNRVIRGDFGNQGDQGDRDYRRHRLEEAGYNYAQVQNLVNERLGCSVRLTEELEEAQNGVNEAQARNIEELASMEKEQLRELGLTGRQITALKQLQEISEKTGVSIKTILNDPDSVSGRSLLINAFANIGTMLTDLASIAKRAWKDIFEPITPKIAAGLYNLIAAFHKFTLSLKIEGDVANDLKNTFKGLFAALDIVFSIVSGPFKLAFDVISAIFSAFDIELSGILDVTGAIGEGIIAVHDWIEEHISLKRIINEIAPYIQKFIEAIKGWYEENKELFTAIGDGISNAISGLKEKISEWKQTGSDLIAGFVEGFWAGVKSVFAKVGEFAVKVLEIIRDKFDTHSPSRETFQIAWDVIQGFINGIVEGVKTLFATIRTVFSSVVETIKEFFTGLDFEPIKKFFGDIGAFFGKVFGQLKATMTGVDLQSIFSAALGTGALATFYKFVSALEALASPLDGLGDLLDNVGVGVKRFLTGLGKNLKAEAFKKNAQGVLILAGALAVLVLALGGLTWLVQNHGDDLWKASLYLVGLGVVLAVLAFAVSKFSEASLSFKKGEGLQSKSGGLMSIIGIAASILLVAIALKKLGDIDAEKIPSILKLFTGIVIGLGVLMSMLTLIAQSDNDKAIRAAGKMMTKLGVALMLIAAAIWVIGRMDENVLFQGLTVVGALMILFSALVALSYFAGEHAASAGKMIQKMAVAMLIMAGVIKIFSMMKPEDVLYGLGVVAAIEYLFIALVAVSYFAGEHANQAGKMVQKMAVAMLIMAGVIKILAGISGNDIAKGLGVIFAIELLFSALILLTHNYKGKDAAKLGIMMMAFSASLLILVGVIWLIGLIETTALIKGLTAVTLLGLMFAALVHSTKDAQDMKGSLVVMTVAIGMLVISIIALSFIDTKRLATATGALVGVMSAFALIVHATKSLKGIKMGPLVAMVAMIAILTGSLLLLSNVPDPDGLIKNAVALGILCVALGVAIKQLNCLKITGSTIGTLLIMSGVIMLLGVTIGIMSTMGVQNAISNAIALSILAIALAKAVTILGKTDGTTIRALKTLGVMTLCVGLLAGMLILMSGVTNAIPNAIALGILANALAVSMIILGKTKDGSVKALGSLMVMSGCMIFMGMILAAMDGVENAIPNAVALGVLANALATSMIILGKTNGTTNKAMKALVVMSLCMVPLGLVLKAMSGAKGAIPNAVALGILANALAAAMVILGYTKQVSASALVALGMMTGTMILLGMVLTAMSASGVKDAIPNAIALSILAIALSGALFILGFVGKAAKDALFGVVALTAMAIPLLAFVGILALMQNISNATTNATTLTKLATVLTLLLIPLSIIGALITLSGGTILLGIVALLAMAIPMVAFVGVLALMQNIQNAEANANLLINLMTTITDMLMKISLVAPLALMAVGAIGGMVILMGAIGLLAMAIGALMTKFPQLEEFLDKGIPVLEKIAYAIGSFVGNLVAGFMGGIADGLPHIGTKLSEFYTNAEGFITGMTSIDGGAVLKGVGSLAGAILALTAADVVSGIAQFLSGSEGFGALGTQLSDFYNNASDFITGVSSMNENAATSTEALVKTILILTAADFLDGIRNFLTLGSDDSLSGFGEQLKPFGEALVDYSATVSAIDEAGLEAIRVSAEAGKTLAEMAESIPNFGGIWAEFWGDNTMDEFGAQLEAFGASMVTYGNSVADLNVAAIEASTPAVKALSEVANNLPNSEGWAATILGDNAIDDFGARLKQFGWDLWMYGEYVDGIKVGAIEISVDATKLLSDMADALPNSGGLKASILGDNAIDDFGGKLNSYGTALKDYGDNVNGLDINAIQNSVDATKLLKEMTAELPDTTLWEQISDNSVSAFGKKIKKLGGALADYGKKISEVDTGKLSSATSQLNRLINIAKGVEGIDFDGLTSFSDSLGDMGGDGIKAFIKAFDDAADKVEAAGVRMLEKLKKGLVKNASEVKKAAATLCKACIYELRDHYDSFRTTGGYLVQGFAAGITSETWRAEARSREMADAAIRAAKKKLNEQSPSKVFYEIGAFAGEGFVLALGDYASTAYNASYDMASEARHGLSDAISRVTDAINSDIDTQPTIRPVLDLSDVTAGTARLSDMLNLNPSMGVLANVGSVSAMMNKRQNGTNNDVISAIKDLGRKIGESSGDTYSINGVTYDDGSNIKDAVQTIVRAARMERRM